MIHCCATVLIAFMYPSLICKFLLDYKHVLHMPKCFCVYILAYYCSTCISNLTSVVFVYVSIKAGCCKLEYNLIAFDRALMPHSTYYPGRCTSSHIALTSLMLSLYALYVCWCKNISQPARM